MSVFSSSCCIANQRFAPSHPPQRRTLVPCQGGRPPLLTVRALRCAGQTPFRYPHQSVQEPTVDSSDVWHQSKYLKESLRRDVIEHVHFVWLLLNDRFFLKCLPEMPLVAGTVFWAERVLRRTCPASPGRTRPGRARR